MRLFRISGDHVERGLDPGVLKRELDRWGLWERYQVRALYLDGRWFHFLQRNDTVAELKAPGLR